MTQGPQQLRIDKINSISRSWEKTYIWKFLTEKSSKFWKALIIWCLRNLRSSWRPSWLTWGPPGGAFVKDKNFKLKKIFCFNWENFKKSYSKIRCTLNFWKYQISSWRLWISVFHSFCRPIVHYHKDSNWFLFISKFLNFGWLLETKIFLKIFYFFDKNRIKTTPVFENCVYFFYRKLKSRLNLITWQVLSPFRILEHFFISWWKLFQKLCPCVMSRTDSHTFSALRIRHFDTSLRHKSITSSRYFDTSLWHATSARHFDKDLSPTHFKAASEFIFYVVFAT